jgi:hypothetical protein
VKLPLRSVAVIGALAAASVALSACDGSPYAAVVGGQVITVSYLEHQLTLWSADRALVTDLNQQAAAQAQQSGTAAETVAGQGGSGTYSMAFADQVLSANVEVDAVNQYLAAHHVAVTPAMLITARATQESNPSLWDPLAEPVKQLFIHFLADEAALTSPPPTLSELDQSYSQVQPWMFSNLCVTEAAFADQAAAQSAVAAARAGSAPLGGARVCFDQAQLEAQPAAFQQAVTGLSRVGSVAAPVPTRYGYLVLQLAERDQVPLDDDVARVLLADQSQPSQFGRVVASARVKVNPAYGSWDQGCLAPPGETAAQACGGGSGG